MNKLFIIEDDELTLQLYDMLLEELPDIEYMKAGSGTEALQLLEQTSRQQWPDCIMVDLNMPDMSGFELVVALEEKFGKSQLSRLFILSNSVSVRDRETARSFDSIRGFLHKPLTIDSIRESLEAGGS